MLSKETGHYLYTTGTINNLVGIYHGKNGSFLSLGVGCLCFKPFDSQGGLGKMHQLFGAEMDALLEQLNEELVA